MSISDHPRHALGLLDRDPQADRAAPVVHDDRGVAQVEILEQGRRVLDVAIVRVPAEVGGLVGAAEAGEVGQDHAEARVANGGQDLPPQEAPRRLAVEHHDGRPVAVFHVRHAEAVRPRGSAAPTGSPAGPRSARPGCGTRPRRGSLDPQSRRASARPTRPSRAARPRRRRAREMYIAASSSAPTTRCASGSTGWRAIRPVSIAFSSDAFTRPRPYWASISRHSSQPSTLGASVIMIRWIAGSVHASRNASTAARICCHWSVSFSAAAADASASSRREVVEHRAHQVLLVAEVVVERAARHAGPLDDLLGADARVPALGEQLARRGDERARAWPRPVRALTFIQSVC